MSLGEHLLFQRQGERKKIPPLRADIEKGISLVGTLLGT